MVPLPPSSIPKPGENVTWFEGFRSLTGKLIGYDIYERPQIINQFGIPVKAQSFKLIRPTDPNRRIEPNWNILPSGGQILKPADSEILNFEKKLVERIPPGPSYIELISEIYYRGFEIYLVGGTVRDILQGIESNDIDLVTTMPLKSSLPLLRSMFGGKTRSGNERVSHNNKTGFIRIGGTPASGDPFIDLKNFPVYSPGTKSALFGSDIDLDLKLRDFACNAIYYDPINKSLIDPSGRGVEDAKSLNLSVVKDEKVHSPLYHSATIVIRLIKFVGRGYECSQETKNLVQEKFCPLLQTMELGERVRYLNAQIFNKSRTGTRRAAYEKFTNSMVKLGFESEFDKYIRPIEDLLNLEP